MTVEYVKGKALSRYGEMIGKPRFQWWIFCWPLDGRYRSELIAYLCNGWRDPPKRGYTWREHLRRAWQWCTHRSIAIHDGEVRYLKKPRTVWNLTLIGTGRLQMNGHYINVINELRQRKTK